MRFILHSSYFLQKSTNFRNGFFFFKLKQFSVNKFLSKYGCLRTQTLSTGSFHTSCIFEKMRKTREEKKFKNIIQVKQKSKLPTIQLWKGITAIELADAVQRPLDDVFEAISYCENAEYYDDPELEIIDGGAIIGIAKRLGFRVEFIKNPYVEEKPEENKDIVRSPPLDAKDLMKRPPVVAIMGHVDHGKTTLLDALRHSSIVSQEHGGITQHIGAFTVNLPQGQITFLDTPGHAAFHTMRARGARATDLVILVVAADDGIMEQTIESVRYAKQANVPIIVAINKIDKASVDVENVKHGLLNCGLQVEDLGGDVQAIPISALKSTNLDVLTEAILIQSDVMGIAGDPKGPVEGVILEASMDTSKGKVSTALIQRGTLKKGCVIVAGTSLAKVRAMQDEHGRQLTEVTPGMPAQIFGWKSFPSAGDIILQAQSEKHAREVIKYREDKKMEEKMLADSEVIQRKNEVHLEKYRKERQERLQRGRYRKERKYFREKESVDDPRPIVAFVLKGDVHGSVEAILDVVDTYDSHDSCRLEVIHSGVGTITENDIELAQTFNGFIYTFNIDIPTSLKREADERGVVIKPFNVIYHLVADLKIEISNKLPLVDEEDILGEATVLKEFTINVGKNKVPVAGCKCTKGVLKKSNLFKVIRSEQVVYNGGVKSLKHEKSDVESIKKDVECGVMLDDPAVVFVPGDTIVCYSSRSVAQNTDWNPGF